MRAECPVLRSLLTPVQVLGPAEEEALARVEQLPVPFASFAACLRHIAAGQLPPIPNDLPTELKQLLETVAQAIHKAQRG